MSKKDFLADRGTGAIITTLALLAIVAIAVLYMMFPVDRDAGGKGKDVPEARVSQGAPETGTTGAAGK